MKARLYARVRRHVPEFPWQSLLHDFSLCPVRVARVEDRAVMNLLFLKCFEASWHGVQCIWWGSQMP